MGDFAWTGKKGHYWISFDQVQDGRIRAQASGPLKTPGIAESIGPIAKKTAETKEEAEALLFEELKRLNA